MQSACRRPTPSSGHVNGLRRWQHPKRFHLPVRATEEKSDLHGDENLSTIDEFRAAPYGKARETIR